MPVDILSHRSHESEQAEFEDHDNDDKDFIPNYPDNVMPDVSKKNKIKINENLNNYCFSSGDSSYNKYMAYKDNDLEF